MGTLCLRAFQMLDLKGQDALDDHCSDDDQGPLHSVIRQEALPLAIRLLGANFHSQESIVSFSNILTDIKLNPTNFLGLAVNLINLLKSHQESGSVSSRHDDSEHHNLSPAALELKKHTQSLQYLQQHFNSCQNIVEVLLCLFRSNPPTFCTADAAGGILAALQDMLTECARVFKIYESCQEKLVILENEKTNDVDKDSKRAKSFKRRDMLVPEEPGTAEYKLCARHCVEVAQLITFETTRLMQLINSITRLTPQIIKEFFMEAERSSKSHAASSLHREPLRASILSIFSSVLSKLMQDAITVFRDHRRPESERLDVSCIVKSIVSVNFCCLVCIHHITSCFAIEMTQMQVYNFSVCAFSAVSSGLQFLLHPTQDRRVKKLAAFKDMAEMNAGDIVPLKTVLETLIICILLNIAHAVHTGEVPQHLSPDKAADSSQAAAVSSRHGLLPPITNQHREIMNQLILWSVRGGGMVASVAVLVASFAQAQLFLPHRLILRVLLQKNADKAVAKSHYEAEEVNPDAVSSMHRRNLPSVQFLLETIRWIDPSFAAQALAFASHSFPEESFLEHPHGTSSSGSAFSEFNVNGLPPPLQVCI